MFETDRSMTQSILSTRTALSTSRPLFRIQPFCQKDRSLKSFSLGKFYEFGGFASNGCLLNFIFVVQFASQEEKRQKNERLHQHQKHENQMRDLQLQCDSNIRELQQLQVGLKHTHIQRHIFLCLRVLDHVLCMKQENKLNS